MTNTVQELKLKDEQYILAQFILINSFIASQFILVIEYQTPIYPITHATVPQPTSSSSKFAKSKKKSILLGLMKKDLISLLKEPLQDNADDLDNEFKTFSETSIANDDNPQYPYDGSLFGHDPIFCLDLFEVRFPVSTAWSQTCYYRHIPTNLLKSLLLSLDMTLFIYYIHIASGGSTLVK